MSYRRVIYVAAIAGLGVAWVSADALAARVAAGGGARAGAVGARGGARAGAVGVRGGAVANRGAVGVRGGAVAGAAIANRGGIGYGGYGGYYRPGLGLAAGAVVGGAIAAGGYGYGGYGSDYYGYNPGYSTGYYNPGYSTGYYNPGYPTNYNTGSSSPDLALSPALAQPVFGNPGAPIGGGGSGGGRPGYPDPMINSFGKCWVDTDKANYRWDDCPAPKKH